MSGSAPQGGPAGLLPAAAPPAPEGQPAAKRSADGAPIVGASIALDAAAACAPGHEAPVAAAVAPDAAAPGQEAAAADDLYCRLHLSCKGFSKVPKEKVERWVEKVIPESIEIKEIFKVKQWGYAFTTIKRADSDAFREKIESVQYREYPITASEGSARDPEKVKKYADELEANPKKKRKTTDFRDGAVPTLKDFRDKEKSHKGAGIDKTVKQKACPLLDFPYATQLAMKDTFVKTAVRGFTKKAKAQGECEGDVPGWTERDWSWRSYAPFQCGCPMDPPIATPEASLDGYRNKCEFTIGRDEQGEIQVGFVLKLSQKFDQIIAPADDIPLVPAAMKKLCTVIKEFVKNSPLGIYNRKKDEKEGVWRTVMSRLSKSGKMLVCVMCNPLSDQQREEASKQLMDALTSSGLDVASLYLMYNSGPSDAVGPDSHLVHVQGAERLNMELFDLKFEIGPMSFFQANSVTCELLYSRAIEWLSPKNDALVFDICCGVGTIGLSMARRCRKVVGIELIPEAAESARQNAALNGIENAEFHAGRAEELLPGILSEEIKKGGAGFEACAIVDPPRPGLHKDVLVALRDCPQISRVVYISCNPESLVEDVVRLTARGGDIADPFVPMRAVAVDMFPHTVHVEMVLLLERQSMVKTPPPRGPKEQDPAAEPAAEGSPGAAAASADPAMADAEADQK